MPEDRARILAAIAFRFPKEAASAAPFLRAVQAYFNWIPPEALHQACDSFGCSYAGVYETANLSPEFCTEPRGRTVVAVCRGLSCAEYGAADVLKDYEAVLGIKDGQTTPDGAYSLCTQNCFGRCATGPNVRINQKMLGGQIPGNAKMNLEPPS